MTAPLTGTDLEIARRLNAGQHPAHIAHVGWYRAAWSETDVYRVALYHQQLAADQAVEDTVLAREKEPPVTRPECGTTAGASKHAKKHERLCGPCRVARNRYQNERRRKTA